MATMNDTTEVAQILIVDRHPLSRSALAALIDSQTDMRVVGQASRADDALEQITNKQPDLVVLEISLKEGNGMELIQQIACPPSRSRVLVLSVKDEAVYAPRVLRAGASGFVSKDEDGDRVLAAIREILQGRTPDETRQSPNVADDESGDIRSLLAQLTDRELEVFEALGHGLTVQQIASRLNVTANTVESYRERIKKKLLLKSGTELTVCAAQWVMET